MCTDKQNKPDGQPAEVVSPESSGRALDLFNGIKDKTVDPKSIGKADRREMVTHLMVQGYSTIEMSGLLHVSDRTIERDRQFICKANAIKPEPDLVEMMVGRLVFRADSTIHGMLKAARDKNASPAVRIDAHHRCYLVLDALIQRLQSLGYLPTAARKVDADVTHHVSEVPQLPEIEAEVKRLAGLLPQESEQLGQITDELTRAKLATKVEEISVELPKQGDKNESVK